MTYVYWFIIAGLVWNCVYYSRANSKLRLVLACMADERDNLNIMYDQKTQEYEGLKAKIVQKAAPEVVNRIPKTYTGAQLRVLNDRLNAQAGIQERPNSEILKEASHG